MTRYIQFDITGHKLPKNKQEKHLVQGNFNISK